MRPDSWLLCSDSCEPDREKCLPPPLPSSAPDLGLSELLGSINCGLFLSEQISFFFFSFFFISHSDFDRSFFALSESRFKHLTQSSRSTIHLLSFSSRAGTVQLVSLAEV